MKKRRATYALHVATDSGWTSTRGYPSRELAEALGEALKSAGGCSYYDVEMED